MKSKFQHLHEKISLSGINNNPIATDEDLKEFHDILEEQILIAKYLGETSLVQRLNRELDSNLSLIRARNS